MSTFLAIDFETANKQADSACAVGLVWVEHNQIVQQDYYLIRPPKNNFSFTYIHGIRWEDVVNKADFGTLWSSIKDDLRDVEFIAAHNASFDKGVLYACCDTYSVTRPKQEFICTVRLAREIWGIYPTKLPNICEYLGIELNHHQALSDAEACACIIIAANSTL